MHNEANTTVVDPVTKAHTYAPYGHAEHVVPFV